MSEPRDNNSTLQPERHGPLPKPVVMIGLMGAGKTTVGRKLAQILGVDFVDADQEIEAAAGITISEIFARHGETAFREGERRVMLRLLDGPPRVIATGGGAFMNAEVRAHIRAHGIAIWLRAPIDLLLARVQKRRNRPLLEQGDKRAILEKLIAERYPVYAEADIVIDATPEPVVTTATRAAEALARLLAAAPAGEARP
ncbi:MAG: shikimate kinase [Alphaproteobacteria bacterium]